MHFCDKVLLRTKNRRPHSLTSSRTEDFKPAFAAQITVQSPLNYIDLLFLLTFYIFTKALKQTDLTKSN